jgi:hypothetical protein
MDVRREKMDVRLVGFHLLLFFDVSLSHNLFFSSLLTGEQNKLECFPAPAFLNHVCA